MQIEDRQRCFQSNTPQCAVLLPLWIPETFAPAYRNKNKIKERDGKNNLSSRIMIVITLEVKITTIINLDHDLLKVNEILIIEVTTTTIVIVYISSYCNNI